MTATLDMTDTTLATTATPATPPATPATPPATTATPATPPATTATPATPPATTATPGPGSELLDLLRARVAAVAFDEPDEFHSWHEAGRELLELAATARRATAYLGGHADDAITTDVPGVVVVRELVAATRALAGAVALTSPA